MDLAASSAEYALQMQERVIETPAGPHTLFLIKVPERTQAKLKWWVFVRQVEFICCHTTKHSSNLLWDIDQLELTHAVRYYKKASGGEDEGGHECTPAQFTAMLRVFNRAKREIDPLCGPGKHFACIPAKVAATLALNRGNRPLLEALGGQAPECWDRADRIAQNEVNDEVDGRDLLLEEEEALDKELGQDELLSNVLAAELASDHGLDADATAAMIEAEEAALGRNYAITDPSVALKAQLQDMEKWRTSILQLNRTNSRVMSVTFSSDRQSFLRFLGWIHARPGALEAGLDMGIFGHEHAVTFVQEYASWCIADRGLSYASLASYLSSILTCCQFAGANGLAAVPEALVDGLINLRAQASKQGKEDRMYAPRHKEWITWSEAQESRYCAIQTMTESPPQNRWQALPPPSSSLISAIQSKGDHIMVVTRIGLHGHIIVVLEIAISPVIRWF